MKRVLLISILFTFLFGFAGKRHQMSPEDYFIPYRNDIHIRNILNYSTSHDLDFQAMKYVKEFFETNSQLPLNNYYPSASLVADIEIMDYRVKLVNANDTYNQYIYWMKVRITLFGSMAKKVFIDRETYTMGKKIEFYPYDKGQETEKGNEILFHLLGENIINLVKFGHIIVDYNYDIEME